MENSERMVLRKKVGFLAVVALITIVSVFLFLRFRPSKVIGEDSYEKTLTAEQPAPPLNAPQYKILHVMSYHNPWK
jgi:hypothetical protein